MKPNEAQYLVIYSRLRLALPLHHRRRRSLGCRRRSLSLSRAMEEKLYTSFSLSSLGFGPSASSRNPLPPSPAPVEVLITEEELLLESSVEPIVIADGLTLHKGRVSTSDVFGLANSDLVPGKYEGGLKLWEGSLDLVKRLHSEVHKGELVLRGKSVLEVDCLIPGDLGCGHGLPGIFAGLEGATVIHFQDFNAEVLHNLPIPNVKVNVQKHLNQHGSLPISKSLTPSSLSVRFFAGDWNEVHQLLLCCSNAGQQKATFAGSEGKLCDGYDVILMAETVYEPSSLRSLYALGKKCLQHPLGVIYMTGKKHYFGVGGGTRQFVNLVEEDGVMTPSLLAEVADGSSNVREVWKFMFK